MKSLPMNELGREIYSLLSLFLTHMRQILVLYITFLCVSCNLLAQTKRALVIGLGEHKDPAWNKINGDKDVPYIIEILSDAKYEHIITCVNKEATKARIVSAFKILEKTCNPKDIVYVHFSGHGQQMSDRSKDETDEKDECWITYDAYRRPSENYKGEKHLTDDEVNYYLNLIRNKIGDEGKMLVVIDACHSGTATREGNDVEMTRGVSEIFETAITWIVDTIGNYSKVLFDNQIQQNSERWITISACKSSEVNVEMRKPSVGKLTYALYKMTKEKPSTNNREFFNNILNFVDSNSCSMPQTPELSGDITRYSIIDILK